MAQKILIIEDSEQDQKILKRCLVQEGYEVVGLVSSGEEGVEKVRELKPDIVILDTNLPGMNGFETCRKIKSFQDLKTKVIIITGLIDAVDAGKARTSGADDYCVKTSDYVPLIETIREIENSAAAQ